MGFFTPKRLVLLFTFLSLWGMATLMDTRINLIPAKPNKNLVVSFTSYATNPKITEETSTAVLENYLSQVADLKNIQSRSDQSGGELSLEFDENIDMEMKRLEVMMLIRRLYPQLSNSISYPSVSYRFDNGRMQDEALRVYMISTTKPGTSIGGMETDLILKELYRIDGVKEVTFSGIPKQVYVITLDPLRAHSFGVSKEQLRDYLLRTTQNSFPGTLTTASGFQYFITAKGTGTQKENIENLILKNENGLLRIKDIATVELNEKKTTDIHRINGESGMNIVIYPKPLQNVLILSGEIDQAVQSIQQQLPHDFHLKLVYDKTTYLHEEVTKTWKRSLLSCLILLFFLLFAYRSFKTLLVLFFSLLVNLCLTFLIIYLLGVNLDLFAIGGLTISFGIMIDNSIVIIDYFRRNKDVKILPPMFAATLCTVAATLMIYVLPKELFYDLRSFSLTVIIALGNSILVSLAFTPAMMQLLNRDNKSIIAASQFGRQRRTFYYFKYYYIVVIFLQSRKIFVTLLFLFSFGLPIFLLPSQTDIKGQLGSLYNSTIGSEIYQQHISPWANRLFGGSIRIFYNNVIEKSGIRSADQQKLYLTFSLGDGNTIDQLDRILRPIEVYLQPIKGIDKFITYIKDGNYGGIEIFIRKEDALGSLPEVLKTKLADLCSQGQGMDWSIFGIGTPISNSVSAEYPKFAILLSGYNLNMLESQANRLQDLLRKQKRVSSIKTNEKYSFRDRSSSQFYFKATSDKLQAIRYGRIQLNGLLEEYSLQNRPILISNENEKGLPIYLDQKRAAPENFYSFLHHPHQMMGMISSFGGIGSLDKEIINSTIYRKNREYLTVVSFDYRGEQTFGERFQEKTIDTINSILPVGIRATKHDLFFDKENKKITAWLIPILLIVIYIICAVTFESLLQPFYVILIIPASFIGIFLYVGLSKTAIDQGGLAAFIMIGGLVGNAAIFLINDLNKLRKKSNRKISLLAAKVFFNRSRPITLSIISCCCSMIPFLIDGNDEVFWYSLAICILSGLLFALITIFILLPTLLAENKPQRLKLQIR